LSGWAFRLIFIHLEEEYGFDIDDTVHLYCLHYVYVARIIQAVVCQFGIYVRLECTEYFCPSCSIAHVKSSVCRVDIVHQLGTRLSSGLS